MPKEIELDEKTSITILTDDDIIQLHNSLSTHFSLLQDMEPISPAGVKDHHMLASAVSRQSSGFDGKYIYNNLFLNCATLIFGIVKNHAFHNGNKRVGFLCLIKHLFENGFVINTKITNSEIYDLLRLLAANSLRDHALKYYRKEYPKMDTWKDNIEVDQQIHYLAFWIKRISVNKKQFLKNDLKVSELKKIILNKGLNFVHTGSHIEISTQLGILERIVGKNPFKKTYKLGNSKSTVKKEIIKTIRKDFDLTDQNGFDNSLFYSEDFIDEEIRNYKIIIGKLAKT